MAAALTRHYHETGNCCFTKFGILPKQFTNDLTNHSIVLLACVILIKLSIQFGSMQLFDVMEVYDILNYMRPLEADLKDVINDFWMKTMRMKEKRMFCFEFVLVFLMSQFFWFFARMAGRAPCDASSSSSFSPPSPPTPNTFTLSTNLGVSSPMDALTQ